MTGQLRLLASVAARHLVGRRRQTIVAVSGVAVGVGFFLAVSAMMIGSQNDFIMTLIDAAPHIIISDELRGPPPQPGVSLYKGAAVDLRHNKVRNEVRGLKGWTEILRTVNGLPGAIGSVPSPHVAIGTSALAVAANAAAGLANHARAHHVKWRCGGMYAAAGVAGAFAGSSFGKMVNGEKLLFLFALVMLLVGGLMLKGRGNPGNPGAECNREKAPQVIGYGLGSGLFSGFFGIGGGFLIVPGLVASTGMPMLMAVGTSLIAATAFGLITATNYAFSGLVDWLLALVFVAGGVAGSIAGTRAAEKLGERTGRLTSILAGLIFIVALYMLWRSAVAFIPGAARLL